MSSLEAPGKAEYARRSAALICSTSQSRHNLSSLAEHAGCSISDALYIAQNGTRQKTSADFDLLIVDLTSISERPAQEISNITRYLEMSGVEALIWTDMEMLEEAYARLPISQCHFLVDGSDIEALMIMSGAIRRGKTMDQLHDTSRDGEFGALHRISDELADFARTLAKIAEQDENIGETSLAEKPVSFRPAPSNVMQPFIEAVTPAELRAEPKVDAGFIRSIIKLRRRREQFFEAELFADPAWDILLDLLAAKLEGTSVSVSSLCIAAAVPATTALRWITGMTESGMLIRRHDPADARRVFIDLSDESSGKLVEYFAEQHKRRNVVV